MCELFQILIFLHLLENNGHLIFQTSLNSLLAPSMCENIQTQLSLFSKKNPLKNKQTKLNPKHHLHQQLQAEQKRQLAAVNSTYAL
jgi:hypothetical protein